MIGRCKAFASEAPVSFVQCDQSSLESVDTVAEQVLAENTRLDVLMCNAGVLGAPPGVSADGYEIHFATNHLGHALLIRKLLPLLAKTAGFHGEARSDAPRVIIVTSPAFRSAPSSGIAFDTLKTPQADLGMSGMWLRYGQSKLANVLYTRELATRYPGILSLSVSPGLVSTEMINNLSWVNRALVYGYMAFDVRTPAEGAHNQLWATVAKKESIQSGAFYDPVAYLSPLKTEHSENEQLRKKLWEWTETELEKWL